MKNSYCRLLSLALAAYVPNATAETEVSVYTSDNTVTTYSPIYPLSADTNWPTSACNANSSIGLDAAWVENGTAYQFGTNVHPWQLSVQMSAQWINAWNNLNSQGPGGHSWTRYTIPVTGVGEFDLIIFDGGGLAGGMFRLETNTGRTYADDDGDDFCTDTPAGATVDAQGCSGAQVVANLCSCSCSGSADNKPWKNHGQYVSCVARARKMVIAAGLITEAEGEQLVETAAKSACGK